MKPTPWGGLGLALALPLLVVALARAQDATDSRETSPEEYNPTLDAYVVEPGDNMWTVCSKAGLKPWQWPQVWAFNPEITNPNWIFPGDLIRFRASEEAFPESPGGAIAAKRNTVEDIEGNPKKRDSSHRVEVIQAPPPPRVQKRDRAYKIFSGVFVTPEEMAGAGVLSNAAPDKIMLSQNDTIYITFPKGAEPKPGDRMMVYRTLRPIIHPITQKQFGFLTEITGFAQIVSNERAVTRARLDKTVVEVERGQWVVPVGDEPQRYVKGTPLPEAQEQELGAVVLEVDGEGAVVAGEQQLVFVDKGSKDGLAPGLRLLVSTRGDGMFQNEDDEFSIDTATLLVVDAKETASTCLVVDSVQEIQPGDPVRMLTAPRKE